MEIPNQENIISSLRVCFRGCSIWYLGLFPQPASTTGGIIFKVEDRDQNPHLKLARTGKGFTSQEMWFCLPFVYFTMICRQMHAACKQFKIITTIYAFISTHAYITYLNILNLKTSQCFFLLFPFLGASPSARFTDDSVSRAAPRSQVEGGDDPSTFPHP